MALVVKHINCVCESKKLMYILPIWFLHRWNWNGTWEFIGSGMYHTNNKNGTIASTLFRTLVRIVLAIDLFSSKYVLKLWSVRASNYLLREQKYQLGLVEISCLNCGFGVNIFVSHIIFCRWNFRLMKKNGTLKQQLKRRKNSMRKWSAN